MRVECGEWSVEQAKNVDSFQKRVHVFDICVYRRDDIFSNSRAISLTVFNTDS